MRLPKEIEGMSKDAALKWLDSEQACILYAKSGRRKIRRMLLRESRMQSRKIADAVREARVGMYPGVCSSPWADVAYLALVAAGMLSRSHRDNLAAVGRLGVYPPKVEREGTGMLQCKACGRWTPRHCVGSSGHCDDCRAGYLVDMGYHIEDGHRVVVRYDEIVDPPARKRQGDPCKKWE